MSLLTAYPHLAARIFNTALLVHPQKLDAIIAGLGQRLLGAQILHHTPQDSHLGTLQSSPQPNLPAELFSTRKGPRAERGYQVIDGVAVLNISGALVHKTRMEADSSTLLGYNSIAADLQDAMDHPEVHAILQIWDSPGGEAQGAFEYADRALALRGKKPFYALADGMAASAGYLGACAADQLAITSTGYAGSIGVVMRHVDMSAALMAEGVRVSHIFAGAKKIDGNSFEPLSAAVRADFQAEIDGLYTTFIDAVAQARRGTSAQALRATQAATYRGAAAITAGLADRIATADTLITELAAQRVRTYALGQPERFSTADPGAHMSHTSTPGGQTPATLQPHAQPPALATPATPVAPALATSAPDPAPASASASAATTQDSINAAVATALHAERVRIESILAHPAAIAQPAMARQCIATGLSVEQSNAILFNTAMAAMGNPRVSGIEAPADDTGADPSAQAAAMASAVMAAFRQHA